MSLMFLLSDFCDLVAWLASCCFSTPSGLAQLPQVSSWYSHGEIKPAMPPSIPTDLNCTNFLRIWFLHISGSSAAIFCLLDRRSKFQAHPWTFRQIHRGPRKTHTYIYIHTNIFTHTCSKIHIGMALMSIPDYIICMCIYIYIIIC